jgi:hypothetical protein
MYRIESTSVGHLVAFFLKAAIDLVTWFYRVAFELWSFVHGAAFW